MPVAFLLGAVSHLMPITKLDQQPSELLDHTQLMRRVAALDAGEVAVSPWEDAKVRIRDRAKAMVRPA
jgi:hypothetical protein